MIFFKIWPKTDKPLSKLSHIYTNGHETICNKSFFISSSCRMVK